MDNQAYLEGTIKIKDEIIKAQAELINSLVDRLKLFGCDLTSPPPKEIPHDMFLRNVEDRING